MQGKVTSQTIHLEGIMKGKKVTILIDGGSTRNFLQTRIDNHVGMEVEAAKHLNVSVGNAEEMTCDGRCNEVNLLHGGRPFEVEFHLLAIYGADAVLGVQWLAGHAPTTICG